MERQERAAAAEAHEEPASATRHGETLALAALLIPWLVLSLLLPLPHMVAALALVATLGALLACAIRWSHARAEALGLDPEAWGLAAVLSLGFSQLLLLGAAGQSGFDAMCDECGRLNDARASFCYGCGTYS